jgi:chromosomal replication initiation ATPase DnaA
LYEVVSRQILGNDQFVERVERRAPRRERKVPVEIDLEIISRRIARVLGVSDAQLHDRGRSRHAALARAVVAYVTREEGSLSLAAIAAYFGRDSSTLTTALQRLEARLDHDPQFAITVEHLRHSVRRKAGRKLRKQIIKA